MAGPQRLGFLVPNPSSPGTIRIVFSVQNRTRHAAQVAVMAVMTPAAALVPPEPAGAPITQFVRRREDGEAPHTHQE